VLPDFADDASFLAIAYRRVLNSDVVFTRYGNEDRRLGFRPSANATKTETTAEFSYTVHTNSLGFRSPEVHARQAGEYRVMLLGDSMFWGIGTEESETIARQIERVAGETKRGSTLNVMNFAVHGYNTVQELIVARMYLDAADPDHVVLGFTVQNDIVPNAVSDVDNQGCLVVSQEREQEIKDTIRDAYGPLWHSTLFRVASMAGFVQRLRYRISAEPEVIDRSFALVDAINDKCRTRGVGLTLVVFYPMDAIDGGIVGKWSGSRDVGQLVVEHCRGRGMDVVDLLDFLHTPDDRARYFFVEDKHPNAEGNRRIAGIIAQQALGKRVLRGMGV
jgi:GDSL-like lipase/acylhydrolase family protein